jgi:hypothetical protein
MSVDLDSACGTTFTYRELLECSNSWKQGSTAGRAIGNVPQEQASYDALRALCVEILDPLSAALGRPTLTYGFAGPSLTMLISGMIAPELDQHAAHERNARGAVICPRLGAAVDLTIPGHTAQEVAHWIHDRRPFDRLYLYGDDRPIHVSFGPEQARSVVEMLRGPSGRRVPRVLRW